MDTSSNNSTSSFLTNPIVKNVVIFISIFNVIGYIVLGNADAVVYFIILGCLMWSFSKNMTIVLGIPIIFTNLFAMINQKGQTMSIPSMTKT